jgi:hypothetical protein
MIAVEIQREIVRLIAELASVGLPWATIEVQVHRFGWERGLSVEDVERLLARSKSAIVALLQRRIETDECKCWTCAGAS